MKTVQKQSAATTAAQPKTGRPFFQKSGGEAMVMPEREAFFSAGQNVTGNASRPLIQTKLTIGQPGDKYEQEADQVADQVVQRLAQPEAITPNPRAEKPIAPKLQLKAAPAPVASQSSATPGVQTKCAECEQEEKEQLEGAEALPAVQKKPIFESESNNGALQMKCAACEAEEETLQPKSDGAEAPAASPSLESRLQSSKGGGSPLPEHTRSQMEGAMGADFSGVRVHTDSSAVQMNKELGAQAFTHGSDVYFNAGKYDTGSTDGQRLLGHELVHTVQQGRNDGIRRTPTTLSNSLEVRIESANAAEREAALKELTELNDHSAWRILLLAHDSPYMDTREKVLKTIGKWLKDNTAFNQFVLKLANNPQGLLSDIAVGVLVSNKLSGRVDIENYRNIVAQNLTQLNGLIDDFNGRIEAHFTYLSFFASLYKISTKWLKDSVANIKQYKIGDMVALGKKTSTLIDRFSMLMDHIAALDDILKKHGSNGVQVPASISGQLVQVMIFGSMMAGDKSDEAFQKLVDSMAKWPNAFANALAEDVVASLNDINKQLTDALKNKPLPSFKKAWANFKIQVIQPLINENDKLLDVVLKAKPLATTKPDAFFEQMYALSPTLESVMDRAIYALQAENMMAIYTDLNLTDDPAKDLHVNTSETLKLAFAFFANLAAERDSDPAKAKELYEKGLKDTALKQALQDVDDWHKILDGEFQFGMLLADALLIVISIYSAGMAGGLARGGMRLLLGGAAKSLAGRATIAIAVWGTEATAFHLSHRALRSVAFGNKFMDDTFWEEYKNTLALFAVLKAGGYMYQRLLAPKFAQIAQKSIAAQTTIAVGKQLTVFSFFQAWTIGTHWYKTGNLIGPGDRKFWDLAVQNAIFLAAVQLGMAATKSFQMPPDTKVPQDWINANNEYARLLLEDLHTWKNSKNPTDAGAIDLIKRARLIMSQRLSIYRRIRADYPSELSAQDLAAIEATLNEFISSVDRVLAFQKAGVRPSESQPNTYYYQGEFKLLEAGLAQQGYKPVVIEATGRVVLNNSVTNHTITLLRSAKVLPAETSTTAVSNIIADSGYNWEAVKAEFGSNGDAVPNQLLRRAWERNWRPGQQVPKDIQQQRDQYYLDKKNTAEKPDKEAPKEPENPNQSPLKPTYDAASKTEAELIADGDPTPRPGETVTEANERVRLSHEERLRRKMDIYEALGAHPPVIDMAANDAAHAANGAHTIDRHGWDIPMERSLDANGQPDGTRTIEGRLYGDAPWNQPGQGGKQNASGKWTSLDVLNEAVNEYLKANWDAIRSDLALNGEYDKPGYAGKIIGQGYRNGGTNTNPRSVGPSVTDMFTIRIKFIAGPPPSFFIVTTFPLPRGIQ